MQWLSPLWRAITSLIASAIIGWAMVAYMEAAWPAWAIVEGDRVEPGFDVLARLSGTKYETDLDRFLYVVNSADLARVEMAWEQREKDCAILATAFNPSSHDPYSQAPICRALGVFGGTASSFLLIWIFWWLCKRLAEMP